MVMKNAMNHKHSRGACFSRDTASDLRLEKVSAPRRVDSTRSPSRPAMTAFCAPCQLEAIAEGPETALLRHRLSGMRRLI